jgi:hypothetical protein
LPGWPGISVDYYTRLEQSRRPRPSPDVPVGILHLLDQLPDAPAFVIAAVRSS